MRIGLGVIGILWPAACFGIFLAWACTVMWGLDAGDPRVAISAMQSMNAEVRNGVFAVAFFGCPVVLAVVAVVTWRFGRHRAAQYFGAAAVVFALGMIGFTVAFLLPLNEGFADLPTPGDVREATRLWSAYSDPWQQLNIVRTAFCALGLVFAILGAMQA